MVDRNTAPIRGHRIIYGAASLDRRIPEGSGRVINHAMATDVVSAASRNYGELRLYATPEQVQRLVSMDYECHNTRLTDLRAPLAVAADVDARRLRHFVGRNMDGSPAQSVLADNNDFPSLAAGTHREIIDRYRSDVLILRGGITAFSRSVLELLGDLQRLVNGAATPGSPHAEERALAALRAPQLALRPLEQIENYIQREPRSPAPQWPVLPSLVPHSAGPDAAGAARPPLALVPSDRDAYDAIRSGVHAMDAAFGRVPDERSERVVAALYAEMKVQGISRIDGVVLGGNGTAAMPGEYVFAWRGRREFPADWISVRTEEATRTPVEQGLARAGKLAQQSMQIEAGQQHSQSKVAALPLA